MVDDQPVEHGSQIISKSPLALVGSRQFAGQELGPEFLKNFVREMLVAHLEVDVLRHGIVISPDKFLHRRLASGGPAGRVWALLMVVQIVDI